MLVPRVSLLAVLVHVRSAPSLTSAYVLCGAVRSVYESKGWSTVASFTDHKAVVTGVGFGRSASLLVATAADGVVKHFGVAP